MVLNQNQILKSLLIISTIVVILNDIVLSSIPEIFPLGDEIGQVISNISLAYLTSYIFYYVVVVIKEKRDKRNIYRSVYEWTKNLIGRAYSVYDEIISASGTDKLAYDKLTITREQYLELCNKANPKLIPQNRYLRIDGNIRQANYGEYLYNNSVYNVKSYSEKIFNYMPFLDTEFVSLINNLHSSFFYIASDGLINPKLTNTNFSAWGNDMFDFLEFVRKLEAYNESINKKYIS